MNLWMNTVDTLPDVRYWSEVLMLYHSYPGRDGTAQNFRPVSKSRQGINEIPLKLQKI